MKAKRKRPVLHTTIGDYTLAVLAQVAKDVALPNYGVTVDYIVADWVGLKRHAIAMATPSNPSSAPVEAT